MKKYTIILLLFIVSGCYAQIPTPAKAYTPFLKLKQYRSGAINIADSLNWNYLQLDKYADTLYNKKASLRGFKSLYGGFQVLDTATVSLGNTSSTRARSIWFDGDSLIVYKNATSNDTLATRDWVRLRDTIKSSSDTAKFANISKYVGTTLWKVTNNQIASNLINSNDTLYLRDTKNNVLSTVPLPSGLAKPTRVDTSNLALTANQAIKASYLTESGIDFQPNDFANVLDFDNHTGSTAVHVLTGEKAYWNSKADGGHGHGISDISDLGMWMDLTDGNIQLSLDHIADSDIHVTTGDKSNWNSKADGNHNHTGIYQPAGSYASSSHTHGIADVSGLGVWMDNVNTYTQNSEDHIADGDIHVTTSDKSNWDSKLSSVSWGIISGKPSTFTPSAHGHTASEITDWSTAISNSLSTNYYTKTEVNNGLALKANAAHGHWTSDITGLSAWMDATDNSLQIFSDHVADTSVHVSANAQTGSFTVSTPTGPITINFENGTWVGND